MSDAKKKELEICYSGLQRLRKSVFNKLKEIEMRSEEKVTVFYNVR